MSYAADTVTSVEKTRAELETVLNKYGADAFGYMTGDGKVMIQFRASGKYVRFVLPLPDPNDKQFTEYVSRRCRYKRVPTAAQKEWEQACRSAWRALFLAVKAKLVAVESKIATFEQEFMAYVVLPNGKTAGEEILPMINQAYSDGKMPMFALALEDRK